MSNGFNLKGKFVRHPKELEFVKYHIHSRYDAWLRGEDYGHHPEDPEGRASVAPQPSAEEFLFNPKNKDKKIPLCLLEPNGKKRRHPIHKKKIIGKIIKKSRTSIIKLICI